MMCRGSNFKLKIAFEVCQAPPLLEQHETAIVDSSCTGHFLLVTVPCLNKVKSLNPLTVRLPNGATMESSHTADLDIPELSAAASKAHVFPGMTNHSLFQLDSYATKATLSLSIKTQSQSAIPRFPNC
jgi:hypothetical protein